MKATPPKNKKAPARASGSRRRRRSDPDWVDLPENELLDLRMCDLGLRLEGTLIEARIGRLFEELEGRGLEFRPHFWLGDEWFSPGGVPGVAVPFYLAHPRLMRLERKMMLEVEGGSESSCMRILRHEAGHALDTAYRLARRRSWQKVFGKASQAYPEYYRPRPYSKSFVLHLDLWYAQSHPSEDFAETFAVWLRPRSRWRTQYQGWGAYQKLLYVDSLMEELQGKRPQVRNRQHIEKVRDLRKTLRKHYEEKRERYQLGETQFYDRELKRLFSGDPKDRRRPTASSFLRRLRPELRTVLSRWTGQYQYVINQILDEVIFRCRELGLRLSGPERTIKPEVLVMLTVQTMNYLHSGYHRFSL